MTSEELTPLNCIELALDHVAVYEANEEKPFPVPAMVELLRMAYGQLEAEDILKRSHPRPEIGLAPLKGEEI